MKDGFSVTNWAYRFRGVLVSIPLIVALFLSFHEDETDWFIWPAGIVLIFLGLIIRIWAQEHIRRRLNSPRRLAITGPYLFVRNPLYVGNLLICIGAVFASEMLWLVPIAFFYCIIVYSMVINYEESFLLNTYKDSYRKYISEVPRWFPKKLHFRNLELINNYFWQSVVVEIPSLFILLAYVLKEFIMRRFGY